MGMSVRLRVGMTAAKMAFAALMATSLTGNVWAETLVIAESGKGAAYAIVVPSVASPSLKYAAEELRDFTMNGGEATQDASGWIVSKPGTKIIFR